MNALLLAMIFTFIPSAQAFTLGMSNGSNLQGWQTDTLTFTLNSTNCGAGTSAVLSAVQDAVQVWNNIPNSKLELKYGGSTATTVAQATGFTATDVAIICDPNFNTTTGQAANNGVVGIGQFQTSNLVIQKGYILLNADTATSTTNNITLMNATQLSIVIAHEMGHVLGLGHSTDTAALMYYSSSGKAALRLSQDDMDGIAYLYPRNEPGDGILGCGTLSLLDRDGKGGPPPSAPHPAHFVFWCLLLPFFIRHLSTSRFLKQIR